MNGRTARGSSRRRRGWFGLAVVAALVAGGGFGWRHFTADAAIGWRTVPVATGTVERLVTALGSVQPKNFVDVGAQVSGQLETIHVEIGDRVERGQLLAEIDPTVFESQVRADRAQLAYLEAQRRELEAQLELAQMTAERSRGLRARNIVSEEQLQIQLTELRVAEARLSGIEAQIDQAQSTLDGDIANLGYTKIYAPMSGTVVSITATEGETLVSSQAAPILLRIADLDTMTIDAQVAEADIPRVEVGMPVRFTTLGRPDEPGRAAVRQVLPTPEIINDVVLYSVLIDVDNEAGLLMTDMTAQVFFILDQAADVPVVPLAALDPAPGGGPEAFTARILGPAGPEVRQVRIGLSDRATAEIRDGLALGDQVIIGTDAPVAASGGGGGMRRGFPF